MRTDRMCCRAKSTLRRNQQMLNYLKVSGAGGCGRTAAMAKCSAAMIIELEAMQGARWVLREVWLVRLDPRLCACKKSHRQQDVPCLGQD